MTLEQVKEARYDGGYFQALLEYPGYVYYIFFFIVIALTITLIGSIKRKGKEDDVGWMFGASVFGVILILVVSFGLSLPLLYQDDVWKLNYVNPYVEEHLPIEKSSKINGMKFGKSFLINQIESEVYVTYKDEVKRFRNVELVMDLKEDEEPYVSFGYLAEDIEGLGTTIHYKKGIYNPALHLPDDYQFNLD